MKILFIHTFYRYKGGEETLVETEISLLENAGVEVELLRFHNPPLFLKGLLTFFLLPFNLRSFFRVVRKIRGFRPDVVHLHNWHFRASPSVVVACHYMNIPIVLSLHNFRLVCPTATLYHNGHVFMDSLRQNFPWKAVSLGAYRDSILQTFWLAFTVYLHNKLGTWHKVAAYIVNSDFEKKIFLQSSLRFPPEKFKIKKNSIPDRLFKNELRRKAHFVFISRLVAEKGVEVLLEAFTKTDLNLVIYGYGPLEEKVKSFAQDHSNLTFRGPLPFRELPDVLRQSSALIFPSIWFEGMPMTLLEAFSTGTPVIAGNIGAMSSMIEHEVNGLHFKAGDSDDLVQKLEYWNALDENQRKQYCQRARKIYEAFYTPPSNLNSLQIIYQQTT